MGATKQMSVRMPIEIFSRLESLAKKTGRTSTYYLREAVEKHLDDLEDLYFDKYAIRSGKTSNLVDRSMKTD